jgi:hypothetical protein
MIVGPFYHTREIEDVLSTHLNVFARSAPDSPSTKTIFPWIVERFGPSAFIHPKEAMGGLLIDTERLWVYRATGVYHFKTEEQAFEFKIRWG